MAEILEDHLMTCELAWLLKQLWCHMPVALLKIYHPQRSLTIFVHRSSDIMAELYCLC